MIGKAVRFGRRYQFIAAMTEPEFQNAPSWTPQGRFVEDLPAEGAHDVRFISAPVLDQRGRVPLALALYGFNHPLTREEVIVIGERLRAVCGRLKRFMFGGAIESR